MRERWKTIDGILQDGHKVASGQAAASPYPRGTISMQKPCFKARGLDLDGFYEGTLNISIAPRTFAITDAEYQFFAVEWTSRHPPENFFFSRCTIIVQAVAYPGWVYCPDPSTKQQHFQDPSIIEVIAPWIAGIGVGDRVSLGLNTAEIRLIPAD